MGASSAATLYSSFAQAPRSMSLQRSEQNGRKRLLVRVLGCLQRGQGKVMFLGLSSNAFIKYLAKWDADGATFRVEYVHDAHTTDIKPPF